MSPKSKEQFKVMRQQSMAAIKEAALELFAERGYAHTSIARIAKEAGISKGLMYNYFDGKEGLLRAIVEDAIEEGQQLMDEGLHTSEKPEEQLTNLLNLTFKTVKDNLHYWKLITSLAFQQDVFEGIQDIIGPQTMENVMAIIPILEKLGYEDPEKEAMLLGASLDGIMIAYMSLGDAYPIDDMKEYLINQIIQKAPAKNNK
ncbi:MAG: TetR/AcrR family transcriptional regulator [Bacteroidetes bacterium]|nr:TetR/AcrR family transcriptional regulator [Bacteroidota bacterium]